MTESRRCGEVYSEPAADQALANPPGCDVRAQCHDQLNPSNLPNSVSTVNTPDSAEQSIPISHFLLIAPLSEIFLLLPLIPMLTQREDQKRQEMLPETRENTREQKETRKRLQAFVEQGNHFPKRSTWVNFIMVMFPERITSCWAVHVLSRTFSYVKKKGSNGTMARER